ncbi:MAG: calcium-binding protein, partial [Actinobacteria bacterium]
MSLSNGEGQANGSSGWPIFTPDGNVVFTSDASNLVPGDTNGVGDIFLRDLRTGETTRLSTSAAGEEANGESYNPAVSKDGNWLAFWSNATNLGLGDPSDRPDIFLRDLVDGALTRIPASGTEGYRTAGWVSLSGDGSIVAFSALSGTLVPGDT